MLQITALFTTGAMIASHAAALHAFCRGYQRGVADYRAAFLRFDVAHQPIYDAGTDATITLLEKFVFTGDPSAADKIKSGIGWHATRAVRSMSLMCARSLPGSVPQQGLDKGKKSILARSSIPRSCRVQR